MFRIYASMAALVACTNMAPAETAGTTLPGSNQYPAQHYVGPPKEMPTLAPDAVAHQFIDVAERKLYHLTKNGTVVEIGIEGFAVLDTYLSPLTSHVAASTVTDRAYGFSGGSVIEYDLDGQEALESFPLAGGSLSIYLDPFSLNVWAITRTEAVRIDPSTQSVGERVPITGGPVSMGFTRPIMDIPNKLLYLPHFYLATAAPRGGIYVIDLATYTYIKSTDEFDFPQTGAGFGGDRGVLYLPMKASGTYRPFRWDVLGDDSRQQITPVSFEVLAMAEDPANPNRGFIFGTEKVAVFDIDSLDVETEFETLGFTPSLVNFDPVARHYYFSGQMPGVALRLDSQLKNPAMLRYPAGILDHFVLDSRAQVAYGGYVASDMSFLRELHRTGPSRDFILPAIGNIRSMVIDEDQRKAFIALGNREIIKFNLRNGAVEGTTTLTQGGSNGEYAFLDPIGRKAYFGHYGVPFGLQPIDLDTFELGDLIHLPDYGLISGHALDHARGKAYVTFETRPYFAVVDLAAGTASGVASPHNDISAPVVDPITGDLHVSSRTRIISYDFESEQWDTTYQFAHDAIIKDSALNPIHNELYFAYETNYGNVWHPGFLTLKGETEEEKWRLDDVDFDEAMQIEFMPTTGELYTRQETNPAGVTRFPMGHQGRLKGTRVVMPEDGFVKNVRFYSHAPGGDLRLSIHDGDAPHDLLWESNSVANNASEAWIMVPISSGNPGGLFLPEGEYLLGWQVNKMNDNAGWQQGGADAGFMYDHEFGAAPKSLDHAMLESTGDVWSVNMEYDPAGIPDLNLDGALSTQWYFGEGATHPNFETYYLLANPHDTPLVTDVQLFPEDGVPVTFEIAVGAKTRRTIRLNDLLPNVGVSGIVRGRDDRPFAVERAMYIRGVDDRWIGAHVAPGVDAPSNQWYLPEGATTPAGPSGQPMETYILIMNPHDQPDMVVLNFRREGAAAFTMNVPILANTRLTLLTNNLDARLNNRSFSTSVSTWSGRGIVVEQAMWWRHNGVENNAYAEGNAAPGVSKLSKEWYLAEGDTEGSDEFLLLLNPHNSFVDVTLKYLLEDAAPVVRTLRLNPNQRRTIDVRSGGEGLGAPARHATSVTASNTIAVSRSMYSANESPAWVSGHTSIASPVLSNTWLLAEGAEVPFGDDRNHTEILIANFGTAGAEVDISFLFSDGTVRNFGTFLGSDRVTAIRTADIRGGFEGGFSTIVNSTQPVMVERTMYFGIGAPLNLMRAAASSSTGFPLPSPLPAEFPDGADAAIVSDDGHPAIPLATPTATVTPTPVP